MTTTVQDIINRAVKMNTANNVASFTQDTQEMLARIRGYENDVFSRVAKRARYFWATTVQNSTNAASARTLDLAALSLTYPIERIIQISEPTVGVLNLVDFEDPDAALTPRYFMKGRVLCEYQAEWGATGAKALTIDYAYRSTAIVISGALSQNVTLPDEWTDILEYKMGAYLAGKDQGRAEEEVKRLEEWAEARTATMIDSLDSFGGYAQRRFVDPQPSEGGSR